MLNKRKPYILKSDKPKPETQTKDTSPLRKGVFIITVKKKP